VAVGMAQMENNLSTHIKEENVTETSTVMLNPAARKTVQNITRTSALLLSQETLALLRSRSGPQPYLLCCRP